MKRTFRIIKWITSILFLLILLLVAATYFYMRQPQFGKAPSGERLARVERSPHYKEGRFHNRVERPAITEGYSIIGEVYKTLLKSYPRREPGDTLPSVKT